MEPEIWKPITDYEGRYEVSSHGRIRSITRKIIYKENFIRTIKGCILTATPSSKGYLRIKLSKYGRKGVKRTFSMHRLVAEHFNSDFQPDLQVNHKNGIKTDNYYKNLECCTNAENQKHAVKNKLHVSTKYENHPASIAVVQLDLNDNFINEFPSMKKASLTLNTFTGNISRCCDKQRKTHKGFKWMYKEDYNKLKEE